MTFRQVSGQIGDILRKNIPRCWDGKTAIMEMKHGHCRQWRQMEWQGFYFQYLCEGILQNILEISGPQYGNVVFDAYKEVPWDFKTHAINTSSHHIIVNDSEATASAIKDYGSVGLILALGNVVYNDELRTFQEWHERLKGGPSNYVKDRIQRGAWSRLRKVSFDLQQITFIQITDVTLVKCGSFQENFRNADGSPRRKKVLIDLEEIQNELRYIVDF